MRGSRLYTFNPVSCCNARVQLSFVLLAAAAVPSFAHAVTTGPTIANNTFASTPVGGSLTQTVTLTLTSAETITSITIQPGQPGATEYAVQSITGCKADNVTQSAVGTVCDVSIKFTPQLPGNTVSPTFARNATLLFTDSNALVFAYGLTGAATGPVAKVVPGKVSLYAGIVETGLNALDLGLGLVTGGYGGDGGPAASATFNLTGTTAVNSLLTQPLALDSAGNLYVADVGNFIIRKIDNTSAHNVTTIAGTPTVTGTSAGSGGLATKAILAFPHAIVVDAAGDIYFIDTSSQYSTYGIVYRIDAATKIITAIGGQLYNPSNGYNSAQGGGTCVPNLGTPGYYECGDGGLAGYASLPDARNLAIDAAGNLYLWEYGGYIRKITATTGIITTFATAADFPSDVAGTPSFALGGMTLASDGNFYVLVDAGLYELIYELNTTTQAVTVVAGGQPSNLLGNCDASGSVNGNTSSPYINIAAGQAGYPGPQLFVLTNGVAASTGDLSSDASGNIYYSGAQCNGADIFNYRPAVFRINLATDTAYLETVGGGGGTATYNYGAYTGFNIAPASAIPDGNGNLYVTTNNQIAVVSAVAGALDFGLQHEFTTGITRIATYENVGNATDTNPTYSLEYGLNFTDVSSTDTSACNLLTQVAVNKTCNIDYQFTPTQPNNVTDTISLAEAAGSNPGFGLTTSAQTVTLTGDATPEAQFVVTPASLSFGNVVVGQTVTKTFTVSNLEGGAALGLYGIYVYPSGVASPPTEYTLGGTCDPSASSFSVPAGSSCTITVTFTPTAIASYPTTLTINNSVTNPEGQNFTITGAGTATSTNVSFVSNVGTALAAQEVTVTIATAGTVHTIQTLTQGTPNLDFTIASGGTCATGTAYTAGETCTVNVGFKPVSAGTRNGAVLLTDSSGNALATTYLPGTGIGPEIVFSPATQSSLLAASTYSPTGVAVDASGNVYVVDATGNRVLKLPNTGSGYGTPILLGSGYNDPFGVAVDGAGNVFVGDYANFRVVEIPWTGSAYGPQIVLSIPGKLIEPREVAVDGNGNLFFADYAYPRVVEVPWTGTAFGPQVTLPFTLGTSPNAVAVDGNGSVYTGDSFNHVVLKLPWTGSAFGAQTTVATVASPVGLGIDGTGDIYVADQTTNGGAVDGTIVEIPFSGNAYGTPVTLPVKGLDDPYDVSVDGAGNIYVAAGIDEQAFKLVRATPTALNFANTNVGSTSSDSPQNTSVMNIGNAPLTFTTPGAGSNPDYPINFPINSTATNLCAPGTPLTEGANCDVSVNFTPTVAGSLSGDVVLTDNDLNIANSTQSIPLSGTGLGAPGASLSPPTLTFSSTVGVVSAAQTLTLSNSGSATLDISGIMIGGTNPGDFAETTTCGATLAANAMCTISVTFTPASATSFSATVSVADTASGSPQSTTLTGTGTAAAAATATLTPNPVVFPGIAVGSYSQAIATLTNTGSTALTGITATITGTNSSNFAIYPSSSCGSTLAAGSNCSYVLHFIPSSTGSTTATLSVADSASGSPQTTVLSGIASAGPSPQVQFTPTELNVIAGTGTTPTGCVNPAESGPALQTQLCGPGAVTVDEAGNVYIVEQQDNVVKKLDTSGNITTFAGIENTGPGSFSGDTGPANAANLSQPLGVAVDALGNVYISDYGNGRIREVNATSGIITTFVGGASGQYFNGGTGTGVTLSPAGIAFDPAGNLYIAETNQQIVVKVTSLGVASLFAGVQTAGGPGTAGYNGDNIMATAAELNFPTSVATDRFGNVYIADSQNYRVRYVNENAVAGMISTAAGNGIKGDTGDGGVATSAEINPLSIAIDEAFDVFISDGATIRKVDNQGNISTFAGGGTGGLGGPATSALLQTVGQPAVDNNGNVLIPISATPEVLSAGPTGILQFGSQAVGTTSAPHTITVENTGSNYLNFTDTTYTASGDFSVTGGTCEGATDGGWSPGSTCTLMVTFTPTATGALTGSVSVPSDATGSPSSIVFQGTGTAAAAPVVSLAPSTLSFPSTTVGATATAQTLTLSNTGNAVLNISGITIGGANPGDFAETTTCGATLAANAMCTISVTFTPASAASFSATVSVADNATGSPQTATLSGTGTAAAAPVVSLAPSTLSFANTTVGATATAQIVTLSNTGNAVLNISGITIGGTNPSDFAETTTCGETLAADAMCTISVTFTPGSVASFAATVSVADNATGSPQTVTLSGSGVAAADFTVSASPQTQTVNGGNAATYNITVASINGDFNNPVTLSATGVPAGATAAFAPATVTPGSESAPSVLTIQTTTALAQMHRQGRWPWMPAVTIAFCIPLLWWRRRNRQRLLAAGLLCVLLSIGASMLSGCGGGYYAQPPSQTYSITVTGTSGSTQHSTTVTLTVQ